MDWFKRVKLSVDRDRLFNLAKNQEEDRRDAGKFQDYRTFSYLLNGFHLKLTPMNRCEYPTL
ncbi:MAG: hypothetical protein RM347_007410 [Nostoc sp. ChiQUE02]